jgi:phosphatidylglycerol:prolipoprotein diacylglycerol transferase
MYPVLFTFGGWQLQSYGVFVAIAFFLGIGLAMREARLAGEDPQRILDLAFYVVIAALVGAKLVWIAGHLDAYRAAGAGEWLRVWQGGLSFWGGFVTAALVAGVYLWRHRLPVARVADMAAPALAAGLVAAELGCLAAGCDYGRPTRLPVGLVFTDFRSLAPPGVPLHPTQLYGAAWALILLVVLLLAKRRRRAAGGPRTGQLALLALAGVGLGHFVIEFFRGDPRPMLADGLLSASQPLELGLGTAALALWWRRRSRDRGAGAAAGPKGRRRSRGGKGGTEPAN